MVSTYRICGSTKFSRTVTQIQVMCFCVHDSQVPDYVKGYYAGTCLYQEQPLIIRVILIIPLNLIMSSSQQPENAEHLEEDAEDVTVPILSSDFIRFKSVISFYFSKLIIVYDLINKQIVFVFSSYPEGSKVKLIVRVVGNQERVKES